MTKNQFDSNEAEAILMEAARRQAQTVGTGGDISRDRLEDMAAELDISPETLELVLTDRAAKAQEAELRQTFIRERRSKISPAVIKFLGVNLMMMVIWAATSHTHHDPWFLIILAVTGINLIKKIGSSLPTSGSAFDLAFAEYKKENVQQTRESERRAAKREAKNAAKRASELAEQELDASAGDVLTTRSYNSTNSDDEVLRVGRGR